MNEGTKRWLAFSCVLGLMLVAVPWLWRTDAYLLAVLLFLIGPLTWLAWALNLALRERAMKHWSHFVFGLAPLVMGFLWLYIADPIVARWNFHSRYPFYRYSVRQALGDKERPNPDSPLELKFRNNFGPTVEVTYFTEIEKLPKSGRRTLRLVKRDELGWWYLDTP